MNTYVLATAGTSMLAYVRTGLKLPPDELPDVREAVAWLRQHEPSDRLCGAEINSLHHIISGTELTAGTTRPPVGACFLVSDTEEGEWVGKALAQFAGKMSGVEETETILVEGLDGKDPQRFATEGLRSLMRETTRRLEETREANPGVMRVLDATGGYKAQMMFIGLIGLVTQVPVIYRFSGFDGCIELPPMPVDFDKGLWRENRWLFDTLSDEGMVPLQRLEGRHIPSQIARLLDYEEIDGEQYVAMSAVLELMHQGFLLVPPQGLKEPPDSGLDPDEKLHITQHETPHQPKGTDTMYRRLAELPWVRRVENIRFVDTAETFRVKEGGVNQVNEILVTHGDGDLGVDIRLITTCTNDAEREWCLEELGTLR